jgi:hypothetical protein
MSGAAPRVLEDESRSSSRTFGVWPFTVVDQWEKGGLLPESAARWWKETSEWDLG